jgi:hypothetical protein
MPDLLAICSPDNAGAAAQTTDAVKPHVPLGGSGVNFGQFPSGAGFSPSPRLSVDFR